MRSNAGPRATSAFSYSDIASELKERIARNEVQPGALLPTERELQEEFGVGRSIVRRGLQALVDSGWAESSPNRGVIARMGPTAPRSTLVGFVDHADTVQQYVFFSLGRELAKHGLHLVHADSTVLGTEGAIEQCALQGFCAAVVWSKTSSPVSDRMPTALKSMPIIAMDHGLRGIPTDVVGGDAYNGTRMAVKHLAQLGRKRIAVSGMLDGLDTTHERFHGYLIGLFESKIQPDASNFLFCMTSDMAAPDTTLLQAKLQGPDRPDAVLVLQDPYVPSVVRAIHGSGFLVPTDIAVVGYGNELPLRIDGLGLTSVGFDWDGIVAQAVQRILLRTNQHSVPPARIELPMELVIRGSCGAPAEFWSDKPHTECGRPDRYLSEDRPGLSLSSLLAAKAMDPVP